MYDLLDAVLVNGIALWDLLIVLYREKWHQALDVSADGRRALDFLRLHRLLERLFGFVASNRYMTANNWTVPERGLQGRNAHLGRQFRRLCRLLMVLVHQVLVDLQEHFLTGGFLCSSHLYLGVASQLARQSEMGNGWTAQKV